MIEVNINGMKCDALIDTGATRSCISTKCFESMIDPPNLMDLWGLNVTTASGQSITPIGLVDCTVSIENLPFEHNFIVCQDIRRPLILRLDFLRKYKIGTGWSFDNRFILHYQNKPLIECTETFFKEERPKLFTTSCIEIPERSLVVVKTRVEIPPEHCNRIFDTIPTKEMLDEYPELVSIPMIHKTSQKNYNTVPYFLINVGYEEIFIPKGRVLAELETINYKIDHLTTESCVSINEIKIESEVQVSPELANFKDIVEKADAEKKFITSPADIEIHRKTELKDAEISQEHKDKFKQLCEEFDEVFSKSAEDIGRTPLVTMDIDTGDNPPICQKPYTLALKHVEWVHKELEILERAGVIVRSVSPWASPIVIVPKKSEPGEPPRRRMCVDYRMLNSLLPQVNKAHSKAKGVLSYVPLPKINEIYAKLRGSKIFSALDLRSGYHHIGLTKEAQPKTTFVVGGPQGAKYEFKVVPFGLTQAPAYFQRLIGEVLKGITFAFGYLDDILIYSPDIETHLQHLRIIFQRLKEAKLKLKESKCSFFKAHIQYLGHLISGDGIEPVPEKLQDMKAMPPPKTPKEVRQFLGLVGYYRKFVPRFSDIARPLTNLTKKDIVFKWTDECQKTFELLKELLMKEPILVYPDPARPYNLYTDASKYAWACVLTQEWTCKLKDGTMKEHWHPITYVSGLFRGSQLNWATLTKEAYAIYMSIKKLAYYLEDAKFTILSDHLPLKKFIEKNTLNTKVNNWAIEISPFRPKFVYISGIKNTLADTMSRLVNITPEIEPKPEPPGYEYGYYLFEALEPIKTTKTRKKNKEEINELQTAHQPLSENEIKEALTEMQIIEIQQKDKFCKKIFNELKAGKAQKGAPYYIENNILKRYVTDNKQRFETIVLTKACAPLILKLAHDELGHNGSARTYMLLRKLYFWKGMKPQVYQYVKQCKTCQKYNITPVKYTSGHFDVPKSPMEFISMDLIGEFTKSERGNVYALTVICMLTGYTFCIPIKTKSQHLK